MNLVKKTNLCIFSKTTAYFGTHNIKIRNNHKSNNFRFDNKVYSSNFSLFLLKKYIVIHCFPILNEACDFSGFYGNSVF